ncbi:MAG: ABC transporter ATP-binding protein [Candidatus Bathyarchaeia archaeon]
MAIEKLEVKGLKTYYFTRKGVVKAVEDFSFSLKKGESLGIVGESGCGKTTLGLSIIRLVPASGKIVNGSIKLDGIDILKMDEVIFKKEIRWKKISMIFQGAMNALNPVYTIGYQISEPLIYHLGLSKKDAIKASMNALKEVGLNERIVKRFPHELSGGMKQRVVIAMAVVLKPDIVIADEPTTALDVIVQAEIIDLLKKLKNEHKISIILLTHDLRIIYKIVDKVAVMYAGELVEIGNMEDIFYNSKHPYTQKLLASIPRLKDERSKLGYIPGVPPDLVNPPSGCKFSPRCPYSIDACKEKNPIEIQINHEHSVKCWLYMK